MDTLITQLDQKYEQYKQVLSGQQFVDSDTLVFDSAYEYFCITETQPKVKEIIEKDRLDFEKKKQDIITYNTSVEIQKEFLEVAEFNSLFFCYSEILKAVYIPLNKHKHALNPLSATDIIGDTPLFRERFVNVMNFLVVGVVKLFRIPIKKDVEARTALYKMTYNFKRKKYPLYMENVHRLLVQQLLELHTQKQEVMVIENTKIAIIIDHKKGIYRETENGILAYKIKIPSNRFTFIDLLFGKERVKTSVLAEAVGYTEELVRKEIIKTNDLFTNRLDVNDHLILKVGTGGYSLNTDVFSITKN